MLNGNIKKYYFYRPCDFFSKRDFIIFNSPSVFYCFLLSSMLMILMHNILFDYFSLALTINFC